MLLLTVDMLFPMMTSVNEYRSALSHEHSNDIDVFQMHSHIKTTEEPTLIMPDGLTVTVIFGSGTENRKINEVQYFSKKLYHYPPQ